MKLIFKTIVTKLVKKIFLKYPSLALIADDANDQIYLDLMENRKFEYNDDDEQDYPEEDFNYRCTVGDSLKKI